MISIRLARGGRKKRPLYTIVATQHTNARDGKFIEKLGQYDPFMEKGLKDIKVERIQEWQKNGAQISTTVRTLLKRNQIAL